MLTVMSIGCQDMHAAFADHAFRPIFCPLTETSNQGSGRDLNPDAAVGQLFEHLIAVTDPS